jgi:hypothetical protein
LSEDRHRTVESGYDLMAEQYLATKDHEDPPALTALEDLAAAHRASRVARAYPPLAETRGAFLATMTMSDDEGRDEDWEGWGAPMVWSHYDGDTNVAMLRVAGFGFRYAEPRTGGSTGDESETWLWVLARKGATS